MSDELEMTVEVTRGSDASDRDKFRTTITADDLDELDERVRELRQKMEQWSGQFRGIQPHKRPIEDDQETLEGVSP